MIRGIMALLVVVVIAIFIYHIKTAPRPNILRDPTKLTNWRWDQHGASSGGVSVEDGTLQFDILKDDGGKGNLSLSQVTEKIQAGHQYAVEFTGKSDRERTIIVRSYGSDFRINVFMGTVWHKYFYTFRASGEKPGESTLIPIFEVGGSGIGTISLKDISVVETD